MDFFSKVRKAYPKVFAHKTVDDRIDEWIGHWEPMGRDCNRHVDVEANPGTVDVD